MSETHPYEIELDLAIDGPKGFGNDSIRIFVPATSQEEALGILRRALQGLIDRQVDPMERGKT